jgi:hypothetical protein
MSISSQNYILTEEALKKIVQWLNPRFEYECPFHGSDYYPCLDCRRYFGGDSTHIYFRDQEVRIPIPFSEKGGKKICRRSRVSGKIIARLTRRLTYNSSHWYGQTACPCRVNDPHEAFKGAVAFVCRVRRMRKEGLIK